MKFEKLSRIDSSIKKLMNLMDMLQQDAHNAHAELTNSSLNDIKLGFRKRSYVRAAYACIEGVCFGMRAICEEANELDGVSALTERELQYILERPDASGKVRWLKADDIVKDSFNFSARVLRYDFRLDCSGKGWQALERTKTIRDRLAHPKSTGLLALSSQEIDDVLEGAKWFFLEFDRMTKSPSVV